MASNHIRFQHNNFDLIRLFAAFQVAFVHAYSYLDVSGADWLLSALAAYPGVPMFFVISGYLISASYERSSSDFSYCRNRVLRIFPALWACFLFSLLTVFVFYDFSLNLGEFLPWLLAQITIGQFYNPEFLRDYGVGVLNGSLWTIPVELQFYFLVPVIYLLMTKVGVRLPLVLFVFGVLIAVNQFYVSHRLSSGGLGFKLFGVSVLPYLYMFLLGMVLQKNFEFVKKHIIPRLPLIFFCHLISMLVAAQLGWYYGSNYLNPVSAVLLALLTISLAYTRTDLFSDILKRNDISYGVYIYHMVFVNVFLHLGVVPPVVAMICTLLCTLFAAVLSWKLIEKPALSLKNYSIFSRGEVATDENVHAVKERS